MGPGGLCMAKFRGPGPVFTFEVLTTSRRWQVYAGRSLFVAGLLAGLGAVWWGRVVGRGLEAIEEQAAVGQLFYRAFAGTQLALALLAAPAATAGVLCLDKARGALAHMLVTDLTAAVIVLGKLGARLVTLVGMAVCGIPFLALGTLMGGIDPVDVAGLFLVSLGGAVLGCSLAMALSLVATNATESTLLTYTVWLIVVLLPPTWWVLRTVAGVPPWPLPWWLEETSPVLLVFAPGPSSPGAMLWGAARFFVIRLTLSATLAGVATAQLRAAAVREPAQGGRALGSLLRGWRLPWPSLDGNPVLWREWQIRRPRRWGLVFWGLYTLLATCSTVAIMVLTASTSRPRWVAAGFLNGMQVSAGLLMLSISAATSLAEERVRGSLDVLLATPLSTRSIVWGKWWWTFRAVPMLAVPPGVALTAVAWCHGHWSAVWLVVGLVVAYGAALTSLGLALATWVRRPGVAVGLCAAAHVAVTVGWVLCIVALRPGATGMQGPGMASFSPMLGVMVPTVAIQFNQAGQWPEMAGWLAFWIAADAALAALLMLAVLATFDRCLGRAGGRTVSGPFRNDKTVPGTFS